MIKLTVQPHGDGKFRLGVNAKDSSEIFKRRCREVTLIITKNNKIDTKTTCGPPNDKEALDDKKYKKGYDIYDKKIDEWIKLNHFHCYIERHPTKLGFKIAELNHIIVLEFTETIQNKNCKCNN